MKKIVFIVNPASGKGKKENVGDIASRYLNSSVFSFSVVYTEYASHAKLLAEKAASEGVDIVAAVGGDGTVNEVASSLAGTNTALAIIPCGSGNGLARHLRIPLNPAEAIKELNSSASERIDYATVNGRKFFCTCGMGLDAEVSLRFSKAKKRGLYSYVCCVMKEWRRAKSQTYLIRSEGQPDIKQDAVLLTVANASQWGNNAIIAPGACVTDGLLDIAAMRQFSFWKAPSLARKLFRGTLDKDKKIYSRIKLSAFTVIRNAPGYIHIDGEPLWAESFLEFEIRRSGLLVIK